MTWNSSKKSMAHCCTTVPTATDDIYLHRSSCDDPLHRKSDEGLIWLPVQQIIATRTVEVVLHRRLMVSPLFLFYLISKLDLPDDTYVHRPVHCWGGVAQQVSITSVWQNWAKQVLSHFDFLKKIPVCPIWSKSWLDIQESFSRIQFCSKVGIRSETQWSIGYGFSYVRCLVQITGRQT